MCYTLYRFPCGHAEVYWDDSPRRCRCFWEVRIRMKRRACWYARAQTIGRSLKRPFTTCFTGRGNRNGYARHKLSDHHLRSGSYSTSTGGFTLMDEKDVEEW